MQALVQLVQAFSLLLDCKCQEEAGTTEASNWLGRHRDALASDKCLRLWKLLDAHHACARVRCIDCKPEFLLELAAQAAWSQTGLERLVANPKLARHVDIQHLHHRHDPLKHSPRAAPSHCRPVIGIGGKLHCRRR